MVAASIARLPGAYRALHGHASARNSVTGGSQSSDPSARAIDPSRLVAMNTESFIVKITQER